MPCSETCDPAGYLQMNPDVAANPHWSNDPCGHYNTFGQYDSPVRTWCTPESLIIEPGTIIALPENFNAVQLFGELTTIVIPIITVLMLFSAIAIAKKAFGYMK